MNCSLWEIEIVWYRSGLMYGTTGDVFLTYYVDAVCDFDGDFEAFGKHFIYLHLLFSEFNGSFLLCC